MALWDRLTTNLRDRIDGPGRANSSQPGGAALAPSLADKLGLVRISDDALGAELERRRRARGRTAHRRPAGDDEIEALLETRRARVRDSSPAKACASLEIPQGASRAEIERAFRALIRQYHPDKHAGDADAHKSAVALATSLADSYVYLLQRFERR